MLPSPLLPLLFHLAVSLTLVWVLLNVLLNLAVFRAPRRGRWEETLEGPAPLVSVLIPARNEAGRLPRCLDSLLRQDYPHLEVIVLDDHSTDGTARVATERGLVEDDPVAPRRLLRGADLPAGWTGKAWACWQLAQAARGEWLLMTDADTAHAPDAVSASVRHALGERADLLSAWPGQETKTWGEKLVVPLVHLLVVGFLPHALFRWLQDRPALARRLPASLRESFGGANGQFLLFRREAYFAVGGHEAVRDHLVEDIALARRVCARMGDGMRLINCDGSALVSCRMYESFAGVWEGFTKNVRAAFRTPTEFWGFGVMQFGCFLLPFLLLPFPGWLGRWWTWALGEAALVMLIRGILTARFGTSWLGCLLHPVGHFLALLIGLNSARKSFRRGVTWKGRTYRVEPERP